MNEDYTLTFTFDNGSSYITPSIRGEKGATGEVDYSRLTEHNTSETAHNDIRLLITGLTDRLNALANSDDETLDQMAELVDYIKDNRELIEQVTTNKVNVTDIIDNLTTNVANKPLSAAQGVALKALIDALQNGKEASGTASGAVSAHNADGNAHTDIRNAVNNAQATANEAKAKAEGIKVPTKTSELENNSGFITGYTETDPTVPAWAKAETKPKYTADEVGARPNTWTPSANDVGARPNTWMPSANDVGALPLSGGTMTGTIHFEGEGALPPKYLQYVCGIDGFKDGGEMGWQSKSEFLSGYAKLTDIPALPATENWTFELEDGTTVTKAVYVG